ncbi:MAG: hypothetical protein GF353_19030 [Candidatus Lokiarchaeota archaeon]|nr:hypothetical protein [Candidatus Lokiarchaeota archaeon]
MENPYAKQKIIEDVTTEDTRVQITGYVKSIEQNSIVLDDTTGNIEVDVENVDFQFKTDDLINVIGELTINVKGQKILIAEIVQNMEKLNFKYYLKLYHVKKDLIE